MINRLLRVVGISILLGSSVALAADGKELAREAYREGTRLYDVGDYRPALEAFKRAYLLFEDSALLFNMAQCYRQLGEDKDAIRTYRSYLRKNPDTSNREEVLRLIAALEVKAAKKEGSPAPSPEPVKTSEPPAAPAPVRVESKLAEEKPVTPSAPLGRTPVYKKWWLWTTVGFVVAGAAIGIGVGLGTKETEFRPTLEGFSHTLSSMALP